MTNESMSQDAVSARAHLTGARRRLAGDGGGRAVSRSLAVWCPTRRDVLLVGIAGLLAAIPFARRTGLALVRRQAIVMGTTAEVAVVHRDVNQAHAAIDDALAALQRVDHLMSRFKSTSDIGRANLNAARQAVPISLETEHVMGASLRWAAESAGRFDPCLGRATMLWDVANRREPPPASDVTRLAHRKLFAAVELGTRRGEPVLRFHDADVTVDLGGIAKGYAVDRAVAALRDHGVAHALVGAGGDLYALGRSPSGEPWHVGIQAPDDPDALAASLRLEDAAIATSGDYQQYFDYGARRYHHLLDTATAAPRDTRQRSVSVIAASCMDADAAATLAFGAGDVRGMLARHGAHVAHSI